MTSKKTILVVQNDSGISDYLAHFLPLLGQYQVEKADEPLEITAKLIAFKPLCLILGLPQAGHSKIQTLDLIRRTNSEIKIIALSESPEEEKDLLRTGADITLSHPIDLSLLSEVIKKILGPLEHKEAQEYARLLIAEDEPIINEFLKDHFESMGLEVFTAYDGKEAVRLFKQKKCNLAIVDLKMPKMPGAEVIHELEQSETPPRPRIIVVVTAALGESTNELRRLGCPIFQKPMETERLSQTILDVCHKFDLSLRN